MRAMAIEVSVSPVWRILTAMDIDLSKVRGWLNRRDDATFWERIRDVCGLGLSPPEQALVLSVDEKTSIQAKQRRADRRPQRFGQLLHVPRRHRTQRRRVPGDPRSVGQRLQPRLETHQNVVRRAPAMAYPLHTAARLVRQSVELFFSNLQRKVIANGNCACRDDLIAKLRGFIADYDQKAQPFKWTFAADPLVA